MHPSVGRCAFFGFDAFNDTERELQQSISFALRKPIVPLESVLWPNDILETHPMMNCDFIKKNSRQMAWGDSFEEFQKLYAERQFEEPDVDWSYLPNLVDMCKPEFRGLEPGSAVTLTSKVVRSCKLEVRVS